MHDPVAAKARALLRDVLSVLEQDGDELQELDDVRLRAALRAMQQAKAEVVAALASFGAPLPGRGHSRASSGE